MVSNRKRYVSESTTDEEACDVEYLPNNQFQNKPNRKPTRTPKCFSKNALMARENRLKKKMYITHLEGQVTELKNINKKLSHSHEQQAGTIEELQKEVKYLKSILANSEGIGKLVRAINCSTGMACTTSLNKKPSYQKVPESTNHPWKEDTELKQQPYVNYPTPESTDSYYDSPEFQELNNEGLLLDMDIPLNMDNNQLLDMIDERALENPIISMEDNNDKKSMKAEEEDKDVGVCLHVSRNKVSLEFCPTCSDRALQSYTI